MSDTPANATGSAGIVQTRILRISLPPEGFRLESGECLPELEVAYESYGERTAAGDNTVFICHALSGDAHAAGRLENADGPLGWWDGMIGPGKGIDTNHYHVVCANILGGCKGTTGPVSRDPRTGKPYGAAFPRFTVGDIVRVHALLLEQLGIPSLAAVIGGSFGGMQALEWAIRFPDQVRSAIVIASAASLSAQALAFDIVGRRAIVGDPAWKDGNYDPAHPPAHGLALARQIGHITYLSPDMMDRKFGRERREPGMATPPRFRSDFEVESYLDHQGEKFVKRFDANSYLHITHALDEFDLEERFGSLDAAFAELRARVLVVAMSSDWLFPPEQSLELAHAMLRAGKHVSCCLLHAPHGHDAFLVDIDRLAEAIRAFLPWVRERGAPPAMPCSACQDEEHRRLCRTLRPGSRILDIGCGGGELLTDLRACAGTEGLGIDIDLANILEVLNRGHDAIQADIDEGLPMIPDATYDYAVLSQTMQVVRKPRLILREMVRVAREGIVSFPNFGYWQHRISLALTGRMPKSGTLPYEWYDTPNIHLFTLQDFFDLCAAEGIRVLDVTALTTSRLGRLLHRAGFRNLGAEKVLVRIAR